MIDLHMHTFFSDGELVPAELVRRAAVVGYTAMAITDHVDESNYDFVVERLARFCDDMADAEITVLPGGEMTHVPPKKIGRLVEKMRAAGAKIVVVHGETIVEPVAPGTNRAAIEAGVDILAHPGLITEEEATLAAERGVALEISGRGGHSFTNGRVLAMARRTGAALVFNTDAHAPRDLMDVDTAARVAQGCGMTDVELIAMFAASKALADAKRGV